MISAVDVSHEMWFIKYKEGITAREGMEFSEVTRGISSRESTGEVLMVARFGRPEWRSWTAGTLAKGLGLIGGS